VQPLRILLRVIGVVEALCQGGLSRVFCHQLAVLQPRRHVYFSIDNYLADLNVAVDETWTAGRPGWLCAKAAGWHWFYGRARLSKKRCDGLVLCRRRRSTLRPLKSQLSRFGSLMFRSGCLTSLCGREEGIVYGDRHAWNLGGISSGFNEAEAVLQNPSGTSTRREGRELCDRFSAMVWPKTLNLPGVFLPSSRQMAIQGGKNQIAERRFVALGQQVDLTQLRAPIFSSRCQQ